MHKSYVALILFCLHVNMFANIYEQNCQTCHQKLQVGIDKFFYRYLLTHSSEERVKKALKTYLKQPKKENSLLADGLILRFGIKQPTKLDDAKLDKALEIYWEKYNLIGKLR